MKTSTDLNIPDTHTPSFYSIFISTLCYQVYSRRYKSVAVFFKFHIVCTCMYVHTCTHAYQEGSIDGAALPY